MDTPRTHRSAFHLVTHADAVLSCSPPATGHRPPATGAGCRPAGLPAYRPGRMFSGTGRVLGELVVSLPMRHTRRLELYRHRDRLQGRSAAVSVSGRQLPARVEPPGIWWGGTWL